MSKDIANILATALSNLDDYTLLKSFPDLIKFKKDVVFTADIVDYFIENYLFEDEGYIHYIPLTSFSDEQYKDMVLKVLKEGASSFSIPHLREVCEKSFDITFLMFKSKSVFMGGNIDLTKDQSKKLVREFIKKMNRCDFMRHIGLFPSTVFEDVLDKLHEMLNVDKFSSKSVITLIQAKNFIEYTSRNKFDKNTTDKIYQIMYIMFKQYNELILNLADTYRRTIIFDFVNNYLLPQIGMDKLISYICLYGDISIDQFKRIKKCSEYTSSSSVRMIQEILEDKGAISITYNNKVVTIYQNNFLHYTFMKLLNIIKDVNNFHAYINYKAQNTYD